MRQSKQKFIPMTFALILLLTPAAFSAGLPFNPGKEKSISTNAGEFLKGLEHLKKKHILLKRNLFEEWKGDGSNGVYQLAAIETVSPLAVYKGLMQDADGNLIAQVNFKNKSFFVREKDRIEDWEIETLLQEEIILKKHTGREISISYQTPTAANESFALITKLSDGTRFRAAESEMIEDYELTEIAADHVKLVKGTEQIILTLAPFVGGKENSNPQKEIKNK